jgi:hypothetical protein
MFFFQNLLLSQNELDRKDYVITKNLDTISENIIIKEGFSLFNFLNLPEGLSNKDIISFRKNNFEYFYKEKRKIFLFDKKFAFLKLLEKGNVNLYEYKTKEVNELGISTDVISYFIERNDKLVYVLKNRFYQIILRVLPDNKDLIKKIRKREYNYFNIKTVIREFNKSQKN